MRGSRVRKFEHTLKALFDTIDDELEERWGDRYRLHPSRPRRGRTVNKEHDGLFNVGASFSAGFGSEHGKGYVVEIRMVTLERVPREIEQQIDAYVAGRVDELLPEYFPGRRLQVVREPHAFKIVGDLSL